jgi:hypothetical protein
MTGVPARLEFDYLIVDTDEWVRSVLGDPNDELTESLTEFTRDDRWQEDRNILPWLDSIREEDESEWSGLYGDGPVWFIATANGGDTFLRDELMIVWASSNRRTLIMVAEANAYGPTENLAVYDADHDGESILDYSRLYGRCTAGHDSLSENGGYTWIDDNGGDGKLSWFTSLPIRFDTMVREYDEFDRDTQYVECPAPGCYHQVSIYT